MSGERKHVVRITDGYRPRAIRYLGLWHVDQWRLKAYTISPAGVEPSHELVEAARALAEDRIAESAGSGENYRVGYVGVHAGKTGNFVFIDWWANENEVYHHVYASSAERPTDFQYLTPTGASACVWDLQLIWFEREAWVATILSRPDAPDIDAYLATTMQVDAT